MSHKVGGPRLIPRKDLLDLFGKDPSLEPIRSTREFKAILKRIGSSG